MEITLEKFQAASRERRVAPGRRPQPYSDEQRKFVVAYAKRAIEAGTSKKEILTTLGISDGTLSKWMDPEESSMPRRFRRVQLKKETDEKGKLTLVTPSGYRIEGLSLDSAVALLSALG